MMLVLRLSVCYHNDCCKTTHWRRIEEPAPLPVGMAVEIGIAIEQAHLSYFYYPARHFEHCCF